MSANIEGHRCSFEPDLGVIYGESTWDVELLAIPRERLTCS